MRTGATILDIVVNGSDGFVKELLRVRSPMARNSFNLNYVIRFDTKLRFPVAVEVSPLDRKWFSN